MDFLRIWKVFFNAFHVKQPFFSGTQNQKDSDEMNVFFVTILVWQWGNAECFIFALGNQTTLKESVSQMRPGDWHEVSLRVELRRLQSGAKDPIKDLFCSFK